MANLRSELFEQALDLEECDRATLAGLLIESLDGESDKDVEAAWLKESERRIAELESGNVSPIPWKEVKSRLFRGLDDSKKS